MTDRIEKTDAEWREELSEEEYQVLRKQGTERAFTGKYWNEKASGTYRCKGCGEPVFSSVTKFDSGSGWPSFYEPVEGSGVQTETDHSHGMTRTEVLCGKCGGHLGHVFVGERLTETDTRHCVNSLSMKFIPAMSHQTYSQE